MIAKRTLLLITLLSMASLIGSVICYGQAIPSHEDSVAAKEYFKSSFKYSLNSRQHQVYLDSALMRLPQNAYFWQQKSMPLYKSQRYELGRPFLDSAVKYDSGRWLEYRGFMTCIFQKHYSEAIADFRLAKQLYGNRVVMDHPYDFYLALCYLQLNMHDSSAVLLDKCIAEQSASVGEKWVHYNHWFYRAVVWMEKEKYDEAIACFDKTLSAFPDLPDAEYHKAWCLWDMKRKEEAVALMKRARNHFAAGVAMNEDNAIYERYPYQVHQPYFDVAINYMERK